jgi:hypothetical protein
MGATPLQNKQVGITNRDKFTCSQFCDNDVNKAVLLPRLLGQHDNKLKSTVFVVKLAKERGTYAFSATTF